MSEHEFRVAPYGCKASESAGQDLLFSMITAGRGSRRVSESVAAGTDDGVVVIREWNPLEPDVVEDKYHALGVVVVLESVVEGGDGRVEIVDHVPGAS